MCQRYGVIDDTQGIGEGTGTMPFKPWPAQQWVFWTLRNERLTVILKARQLGISWCVCWYVLWCCLWKPGQLWLLFSKGQNEANELIRRIRALHQRLPGWVRESLPAEVVPGSVSAIAWQNGSRVKSMPNTRSSGVSYAASGIVLDEAAKMLWADDLYAYAKPTIDSGNAQLVMLSTAEGVGNLFHTVWEKAEAGQNGFKPVFLPWWCRPDRDAAWYRAKVRESASPKLIKQEYPSSPHEAFLTSGRTRFETEWVDAQRVGTRVPRELWTENFFKRPAWPLLDPTLQLAPRPAELPGLVVFALPDPTRKYVVACDVAEGKDPAKRDEPDYDAAVVIDEATCEEVAVLHGQWAPDQFGKYAASLAWLYNLAEVAVERNNHGHAVLATLRLIHYPRVGLGHDGDQGWHTNVTTKPQMIDLLAECLREGLVTVRYGPALHELRYYTVLANGTTSAPRGRHDDLVMAWAVGLSYLRHRNLRPRQAPPRVLGDRFKVKHFLGRR